MAEYLLLKWGTLKGWDLGNNEKAKAAAMPQTPEVLALDARVKEQGEKVRALKAAANVPQAEVDTALQTLLSLKAELQSAVDAALAQQAASVQLSTA